MRCLSALIGITATILVDSVLPVIAASAAQQRVEPNAPTVTNLISAEPSQTGNIAEAPLLPARLRQRPDSDQAAPDNPTLPNSASPTRTGFNYRLIVQGSSDRLLQQVRRIAPDAFRASISGQRVIQAGLFETRQEAEAIQQQLSQLNVATRILELNQPLNPTTDSQSPPFNSSNQTGFKYRLIVQGSSDWLLQQVRRIAPDAFRTSISGQRVIQAGLFETRQEAEAIQQQLEPLNVATNIFDINYGVAQRPTFDSVLSSAPVRRDGRVLVVIDPGHGGNDPGAVGISGLQEAGIVLDIAKQVGSLLEKQGIQAVLTRQDDREIDLEPRVSLAESLNANLFVSIHANSINLSRPDINGIETYYYDSGSSLASSIHRSVVNTTGMEDRGIHQARFYVLTHTSMPAVLVEVGFVTGREDAAKLNNPTWRDQIAAGIAQGILRYVQQRL
jgi:N-acetylmuramoyl-L-alanine amidase